MTRKIETPQTELMKRIESPQPEFKSKAAKAGNSRGVTIENGIATKPDGSRVAMAGTRISGNIGSNERTITSDAEAYERFKAARAASSARKGQDLINKLTAAAGDPNEFARIASEHGVKAHIHGDGSMQVSPASRDAAPTPTKKPDTPRRG